MIRLAFAATLALAAGPVMAERVEVYCERSELINSGTATLCAPWGSYSFQSDGPEVEYFVTLRAPASHCAPVVYSVYAPGENWSRGFTRTLQPGESENVSIGRGYGRGSATIQIAAMGIVQGCNVGQMHSWAVEVSAAPVP